MNKDNIYIRKLEKEDWKLLRTIRIEAVKSHPNFFLDNEERTKRKRKKDWQEFFIDKSKCAIFGLFDNDTIIGITGAFRWRESPDDTVILGMSYIRPEYRGLRLSRLYYEERLNWARSQKGIKRIIVSHREGNTSSKAANQNFGFKYYETEEISFGDGSKGNDIRYELLIESEH